MTRLVPWLALTLLLGCAAKRQAWDDPRLPEASEAVAIEAPHGVLTAGADNDDPSVRGRALELLIRTGPTDEAASWAERALWDPDPWVQERTVLALDDRIAQGWPVPLLDEYVRRQDDLASEYAQGAAAIRLARAGHTEVADAVAAAWPRHRNRARAAPLQLAALILGDETAAEPLAKTLAAAEVALEPTFLLDLGQSGQTALIEPLTAADKRVEPEMRLAFATARMLLGDPKGGQILAGALGGDAPLAALEALDYLSQVDTEASTALIRKARRGGTDLAQTYAALALAARGDGDLSVLEEALLNQDPEVRALAARFAGEAVGHPGSPRKAGRIARRVLETALADEAIAVRLEALRAASRQGVLVPTEQVRQQLADGYLAVRIEAAGALLAKGT